MNIRARCWLVIASISLLSLTACSLASDSDAEWDGAVQDSAGVALVHSGDTPLWGESDRWVLSDALRIGVVEGQPEYMFGRLAGMGVLSDGSIVAADGMAQHVRIFDSDGRWKGTIGGPGAGPGELGSRGLGVLVGPGDTLLILDWEHQRANRFSAEGAWLGSWQFAPEDGWRVRDWKDAASGRIVTHMARMPGMEASASDSMDFVIVRDLSGAQGDTVGSVPASRLRQVSGGGQVQFYLYAGEPQVSLCPDNSVITGRGDRYEIKRYDASGRLKQVVTFGRQNTPITESDRTFLSNRFKEIYLESGFTLTQVDDLMAGMHFTETYPAFVTLQCGPRGSIWVQPVKPVASLSQEEREDFWVGPDAEAAAHFDVFDRQGRFLGTVPLPPGFWPRRFHGDRILGRWRDSLDVEYVKVLDVGGLAPLE